MCVVGFGAVGSIRPQGGRKKPPKQGAETDGSGSSDETPWSECQPPSTGTAGKAVVTNLGPEVPPLRSGRVVLGWS